MSVTSPTGTPATRTFDFLSRPATESKIAVTFLEGPPPTETRSIFRTKKPRIARITSMKMPTFAAEDMSLPLQLTASLFAIGQWVKTGLTQHLKKQGER